MSPVPVRRTSPGVKLVGYPLVMVGGRTLGWCLKNSEPRNMRDASPVLSNLVGPPDSPGGFSLYGIPVRLAINEM